MKRLICICCWAAILLSSCTLPGMDSARPPEGATPTRVEINAVEVNQPTATTAVMETATRTTEPQPSATAAVLPETPTPVQFIFPTPQPLTSGEPVTITQIQMFDTTTGWGTGYQVDSGAHILFTEDGGRTWADRTPPELLAGSPGENESVWTRFLDPQTAWAIYAPQGTPPPAQSPMVWRTTDSGLSWQPSPLLQVDGMEDFFKPEGFASFGGDHGWLLVHVGGGMSHDYSYLYATHDGGVTWERVADPYGIGIQSLLNTGLAFADSRFGWVTKDNLGIMAGAFFEQTTDGGTSWEDIFLPAPPEHDWLNEVSLCETSAPAFTGDQTGALVVKCKLYGDNQTDTGWSLTYIYTTSDRGKTWEHVRLPSPVESLVFLDMESGWAFGRDYFRTSDAGTTWEPVKSVNWDGSFTVIDALHGWAVARNEGEIALVVTEDGGQSWQIIEPALR